MAPFNPEVPRTNDPNYGNNSRAIDTPDGIRPQGVQQNQIMPEGQKVSDRSAEYTGQAEAYRSQGEAAGNKAFGDLFANVVGIADYLGKGGVQLVKKDIENKVYEIASAERSAYTAELEKIKEQVGVKNILSDSSVATNADGDPIPEAVSELGTTLATLKSARDGGKITKTDYNGRLAMEAQNLRSMYPGFKQEIDAEFAKVTGQNPANARVNGLITEINRAVAASGSQQNKTLQYIRQNDYHPRAVQIFQDYVSGKITDGQVFEQISQYKAAKEKIEIKGVVRRDNRETREERQVSSRSDADYTAGVAVSALADQFATKYGFATREGAEQLQRMAANGQVSAQQWAERATELQLAITRKEQEMLSDMRRLGVTRDLKGGNAEATEVVKAAMEPMYNMLRGITEKDTGQMFASRRQATAILDQNKLDLLKKSKVGPFAATLNTVKELGGEQYATKWAIDEVFGKSGIKDGLVDFVNNWGAEFRAQNGVAKYGKPSTFKDFAQEMKDLGITDPVDQKRVMMKRIDDVSKISSPDTPDSIKINIADAAFSPGNNGFMSMLNVDSFDERGRPIQGMNAVFQKWTTPEISREMERLGRKNPEVWNQYVNWVRTTWASELMPRELAEMSNYQKDPNIRIGWDTENKRFTVERTAVPELQAKYRESLGGEGRNTAETIANQQQFQTVSRSINRINSAIYNLRHVAAMENPKDPTATDAFILKTIVQATSPAVVQNLSTLPGDLVSKILQANRANKQR